MNKRKGLWAIGLAWIVAILIACLTVGGCSIILAYQTSDGGSCSIVQQPVQPIEVGVRVNQRPTTQPSGD